LEKLIKPSQLAKVSRSQGLPIKFRGIKVPRASCRWRKKQILRVGIRSTTFARRRFCSKLGAALDGDRQVELHKQSQPERNQFVVEKRACPRFAVNTEIRVYARNCPVVRGHTVDISESGIAAMLLVEVPLGEVVRLEFALPLGAVEVHAVGRQRNAFRYGFQFVEASSERDIIGRTCRDFAMQHLTLDRSPR
jgi:hypothetical protein